MDANPQNSQPCPDGGFDLKRRHRPALFLSGHSVYLGLVFVFPFLLTYAIHSKSEFARLAVYINWLSLLIDGGTLGLGRALQQLAIQTPEEELRTRLPRPLQGAALLLAAILGTLTAVFALVASVRLDWFEGQWAIAFWLWLAAGLGLTRLCFSFLIYGIRKYHWYIGIDVAWAVARLAVIPLGWRLGGVAGALAGNALLYAVMLAVSIGVVGAAGVRPAWGAWRRGLGEFKYFFKLGFWMQLTWLAPTLARPAAVLVLAWMLGRDQAPVGLAHLSISVLTVAAILLESLFLSLYPEKARAGVEGRRGELAAWANEEARALGFLLWPPAVAAAALAWVPVLLLPEEYHDLAAWLGPIALALPARAMAAPLITALQAGHRPARGAYYQVLRLGLDLIGLALALKWWGGVPAAPAWGILAGEWAATAVLFMLQTLREGREWGKAARAGVLFALIAAWIAGLALMAHLGPWRWVMWMLMSGAWYVVLPWLGITSWENVRMTFTPQREAAIQEALD